MRKTRVLVVDDSLLFRKMLVGQINAMPDMEVVGEAGDPYDASEKITALDPDVMSLDIEMPNMNGVEFLKVLLPQWKIPVVVVSSLAQAERAAVMAGAAAFVTKPGTRTGSETERFITELTESLRRVSPLRGVAGLQNVPQVGGHRENHIIALGASTGGTQATATIIKMLPADTPGIVVVQHMPPDFTKMYAEGLNRDAAMTVVEARDAERIEKGKVIIAPGGDRQCRVARSGDGGFVVSLKPGAKVSGHCPSVDVLFQSMAQTLPGRTSIGVILTGMGADGANGITAMRSTGSYTIGQDEATCVVYGMPKEAYDRGGIVRQAALGNIAGLITTYVKTLRGE